MSEFQCPVCEKHYLTNRNIQINGYCLDCEYNNKPIATAHVLNKKIESLQSENDELKALVMELVESLEMYQKSRVFTSATANLVLTKHAEKINQIREERG